jgi:hypothetical protein
MNLHKVMLGIGIVLLLVIPIWIFFIVPEMEKLPKDYNNFINYNRQSNTNHEIGGVWTGEKIVKGESKEKTIRLDKNVQVIEGQYNAYLLDNEKIWDVKKEYGIDRLTRIVVYGYGQYAENSYFHFPPKLKKQSYSVWVTQYFYPLELRFIGVENIQGLEAYHFEAKNFVFDDSEGFEWLDLVPEVYNVHADGTVNVWVEPITGTILDFKGGGVAYYADKETDEKIQDMQTWSNKYSEDSIANQVRLAQNEKQRIYLLERIVPILLGLVGIALIFASFIGRRLIERDEKKPIIKPIIPKKKEILKKREKDEFT